LKRIKVISSITLIVGILMISVGMVIQNEESTQALNTNVNISNFKIQNMAASTNMIIQDTNKESTKEESNQTTDLLTAVDMETAPASVIVPPRIEVYEGMTLEELAIKLDRNLGNDIVAGKGALIASECVNKGVDPYVAVAILLHETGCKYSCSKLARTCNNFGGQKGSPSCNGGSYKAYNSIDEGLVGFIDNLYRNYYSRGLNTVESIGPKYAESNTWVSKINSYVSQIRAN
jgi:hypothetical protein